MKMTERPITPLGQVAETRGHIEWAQVRTEGIGTDRRYFQIFSGVFSITG